MIILLGDSLDRDLGWWRWWWWWWWWWRWWWWWWSFSATEDSTVTRDPLNSSCCTLTYPARQLFKAMRYIYTSVLFLFKIVKPPTQLVDCFKNLLKLGFLSFYRHLNFSKNNLFKILIIIVAIQDAFACRPVSHIHITIGALLCTLYIGLHASCLALPRVCL